MLFNQSRNQVVFRLDNMRIQTAGIFQIEKWIYVVAIISNVNFL